MTPIRSEEGSSLIEILVAISILGIVVTGVLGALATGLDMSALDRTHAKAEAVLRSYAEAVHAATPVSCLDGTPTYVGAFADDPDDGVAVVPIGAADVRHWVLGSEPASFLSACPVVDLAQRITLRVQAADDRVGVLEMDIVKFVGAT